MSPITALLLSGLLGILLGAYAGLIIFALLSVVDSGSPSTTLSPARGEKRAPQPSGNEGLPTAGEIRQEEIAQMIAKDTWDDGLQRKGYGLRLKDGRRVLVMHYSCVVDIARNGGLGLLEQMDMIVCCRPGRVAREFPSLRMCGDWDGLTYAGIDWAGDFVYRSG